VIVSKPELDVEFPAFAPGGRLAVFWTWSLAEVGWRNCGDSGSSLMDAWKSGKFNAWGSNYVISVTSFDTPMIRHRPRFSASCVLQAVHSGRLTPIRQAAGISPRVSVIDWLHVQIPGDRC